MFYEYHYCHSKTSFTNVINKVLTYLLTYLCLTHKYKEMFGLCDADHGMLMLINLLCGYSLPRLIAHDKR